MTRRTRLILASLVVVAGAAAAASRAWTQDKPAKGLPPEQMRQMRHDLPSQGKVFVYPEEGPIGPLSDQP